MKQDILSWYKEQGRHHLPWRQTHDAYKIWVSEIMLQQTQVKTVLERFYYPFIEKFPTLSDLANADEDEVLKAWEGLGYYTRARNLHKAAKICHDKLPTTAKELEELPGIGRSTAHAIACFAYGESLPILDANVKRILYRFYAVKKASDKELWELAYRHFDSRDAYSYNQAMMDIGSSICTRTKPQCDECPFEQECEGKSDPTSYPTPKAKKSRPTRYRTIVVSKWGNRYALLKGEKRLLGGLWHFPQEPLDYHDNLSPIAEVSQYYSHFILEARVIEVVSDGSDYEEWFEIDEIGELALSGVDRKVLELIS
jgi:A/G-specific adenine glycosylase